MFTVFKKELMSYFYSPIFYVFIAGFMLLSGIFFIFINFNPKSMGNADFNLTLENLKLILLFIIPAIIAKSIADERKNKTDQLLLTSPVRLSYVVCAKFFAGATVFLITILVSLIFPIILYKFGNPSIPEVISGYLGFFLLGLSFISICLFASSITESVIVAFLVGFAGILSMWLIGFAYSLIDNTYIKSVLEWISLLKRYDTFREGILKPAPIVYYISVIILFIFLTIRMIEKRRWSEV